MCCEEKKIDRIARMPKCAKCGKGFLYMSTYRNHILYCRGNGYYCKTCGNTFKDLDSYQDHKKIAASVGTYAKIWKH